MAAGFTWCGRETAGPKSVDSEPDAIIRSGGEHTVQPALQKR